MQALKNRLAMFTALCGFYATVVPSHAAETTPSRPNTLILFADDK